MKFISILLSLVSINFLFANSFTTIPHSLGEGLGVRLDTLQTPFEKSNGKQSATYQECIAYYNQLSKISANVKVLQYGTTSIGKPLNLIVISKEGISKQKVSTYDMEQSGTVLSIGESPLTPGVALKVSVEPTAKKD